MKDRAREYYDNWDKLSNRLISEEEWKDYCMSVLSDIMEENQDVFNRLKVREDKEKEL